ncbi:zinc finger CCCH domain-containing protein [Trifolium repens]|nr:zinc finger CCCH domain-containing protein [Trifolium repens]
MYNNQVNRGPNSGQSSAPLPPAALPPPPPLPPGYQQALPPPPPPPHFQHFVPPVPPPPAPSAAPHVYLHGTPSTPNTRPSYSIPSQMAPQTFPILGQNSQHSNLGVQSHTISPSVPTPIGHSHQDTSWAPGLPSRVLPPPPSSSQGQILHNQHLPAPPPPPFRAPSPDGVYFHSTVGNCQVPSVAPPLPLPPLPTSPPPVLPSPPVPTSVITSTSSQAACTDVPASTKNPSFESKDVDSVDEFVASCPSGIAHNSDSDANRDGGNCGEVAPVSLRDEPTRSVMSLPPPPPQPAEENTVGTDSDMEMEDDITLSDKDQGSTYAIEVVTQQHDRVDEVSMNEKIQLLQNSTENEPAKTILSSDASCFGSTGVSKQNEGPGPSSDVEPMKSARSVTKVRSPMNDSVEVAESLLSIGSGRLAAPLDKEFIRYGTSDHSEATDPNRDSEQLMRIGSPIRLLQDYTSDGTSDNEDEGRTKDANNVFTVSAGAVPRVPDARKDCESNLETDIRFKRSSYSQKEIGLFSKSSQNNSEISPCLVQESEETCKRFTSHTTSDGFGGTGFNIDSNSGTAEQEHEKETSKFEPTGLKVDEFGRHIKEGATDSDSDESRSHRTRRMKKRDRSLSRSRSRSPVDRRSRRRRSPRRRKDKRSQSRSWSPRRRRSRSRSPILRRSGDIHSENVRRDKDKAQCFDFSRRKCYRGALCRFSHHESDRNATSRRSRNKHDLEPYSREKSSRINEGVKSISSSKVSDHEYDGVRIQDIDRHQNITGQEVVQKMEDSEGRAVVSTTFSQSVNCNPSSEGVREVSPKVQETLVVREKPETSIHNNDSSQNTVNSHQQRLVDDFQPEALSSADAAKDFIPSEGGSFVQQLQSNVSVDVKEHSGGTSKDIIRSEDGSSVQKLQSNVSAEVPEHSGYPSQLLNAACVNDLSSDKRSMISANEVSGSEPLPCTLSSTQLQSVTSSVGPSEQPSLHSQASKELPPQSVSSVEFPLHTYPLPAFVGSHSQGENAVHIPQIPRQYGVMQQNAFFPFQSNARENFEPYPAPLQTPNSHFSGPPHSSWTSLPPPPPPPPSHTVYNTSSNMGVAKSFISSEFNQNQLHSRTDYVSQTSMIPGLPTHSQSSKFEDQVYPPMQDHSRTFMRTEPFSPKHLHQGNPTFQSLSSSTSFGGPHHQPKHFSWESDVNRPQPPLGGRLPPEGHFSTSSLTHPLSQQQQSVHNFQYTSSDVNLAGPGGTATVSRYPPDVPDSNHSTALPGFGASRASVHYNPYASTFEQPLSSKLSSSFLQDNDMIYSNNYGPSRYREGDGVGSRETASPKPARAVGQILPGPGEQYDPLFDSIEPSSSLKKFDFEQKQEVTGESNISLRPKSSQMSLDAKEKKHGKVGAVASTSSLNNDEYGETADAEVGAVENESLSNDIDDANMSPGEDEINQIKSPGKRKKSKDSRSMKLFKVSIANFVKEVLKPSWRQGNMSKVAFKTIVKKTVDKVSGAMKGHRIPKSQEKITQYIDSSQRKLTKLVMGYVDKYVKV